ncbi:MAG: hypothetical protein Q8Q08_04685 [Candidatus Omnitrophota bacterium]|nr:hypothetical protein [Candidatus Omnitrophota bacterium]MDZ4242241.1 hypothetical protein [Candidatus Omnitrophota bacterium]
MKNKRGPIGISFKTRVILLAIPLGAAVMILWLKSAAGPYWLGPNFDPAYIHLVNSLYLLDGVAPIFVDHPGITLQILGALVIRLLTWPMPSGQIAGHVFDDPEYYLGAIHAVMLVLYVVSLFWLGQYTYRKTRDLPQALLIQLPAFLFLTLKSYRSHEYVLPIVANVNSETLMITFLNVFLGYSVKLLTDDNVRDRRMMAVVFGIICALGTATKISFLPLILIPLFCFRRWVSKALLLVSFAVAWVAVTSPILPRYGKVWSWLTTILTHKGFHGSGGVGLLDLQNLGGEIRWLLSEHSLLFILLAGAGGWLLHWRLVQKRETMGQTFMVLEVAALALFCQILMVLKQPAPHYLAPGYGLTGILLVLLYTTAGRRVRNAQKFAVAFIVIFVAATTAWSCHYRQQLWAANRDILEFSRKVYTQHRGCAIFGYYRSSSPMTALDFGDDCFGFKHYAGLMQAKFPDALFYNRWTRDFHAFDHSVSLPGTLDTYPCTLLYGSPMDFPGYIKTELVETGPDANLYRVTAYTGREAAMFYVAAKVAQADGDYHRAMAFALKAKELGFRPEEIDPVIEELGRSLWRTP